MPGGPMQLGLFVISADNCRDPWLVIWSMVFEIVTVVLFVTLLFEGDDDDDDVEGVEVEGSWQLLSDEPVDEEAAFVVLLLGVALIAVTTEEAEATADVTTIALGDTLSNPAVDMSDSGEEELLGEPDSSEQTP